MKRKIMFVIENSFFGGGERAFAQIINGLNKEKFEVFVACLPEGIFVEKIKDGAEIIPLNFRNRFNLMNISQLARIVKEKKISIIHSQGARADFFARLAAHRVGTVAIVSTVQMPVEGFDVNFLKKAIYVILDRFSEKFVDKFIVVSEVLRKRLIEKHRIPPEKVSLIYNGVELEEYNDKWVSGERIREQFKIEKGIPLIGTVGRLVWQKGLPYFIQAVKIITQPPITNHPLPVFLIVGEGELKENLELRIKNLELSDRIIFTGFRKDVKEILSALDILVLSSLREGFPMITLEAMAMGKPVVATDIEGIKEQVVNGETGILVPPKNPKALAEAIIKLAKSKELREKMGSAGRKLVEEKFNIKKIVKQYEQLYPSLTNSPIHQFTN